MGGVWYLIVMLPLLNDLVSNSYITLPGGFEPPAFRLTATATPVK